MLCSSYDNLVELLDEGKRLILHRVELQKAKDDYRADDFLVCEDLEALVLFCGCHKIYVACSGETDEVQIVGQLEFDNHVSIDLSQKEPWSAACGKELFSVWKLINQRGYNDGLQFEFGVIGEKTRILVDGAGSQIRVWAVQPYE